MVDRKSPRPYIAALCGVLGLLVLHRLFGWDKDTIAMWAGIGVAAIIGAAMVRNKIRTGRWTVAPKSATQTDE